MKRLALLSAVMLVLVACGDGEGHTGAAAADTATASVTARVESTGTPLPTLASSGEGTTPAAGVLDQVVAALARDLAVAPAGISVVSVEPRTWPDGCLGIWHPGQACTQALVPGWLAVLRGPDGTEYRYRGGAGRFEREP